MLFQTGSENMRAEEINGADTISEISLRPHHGMCLAYFEGKGYSVEFTVHMQNMLEILTKKKGFGENVNGGAKVRLTVCTDEICTACPNNIGALCREETRVRMFDQGVLETCQLEEGQVLDFEAFAGLVQRHIIDAGKRQDICGGCQWESICANKESRWESLYAMGIR